MKNCVLRRAMAVVALTFSVTGVASAQDLKSTLPTDPHVIKGKFPNGLTYYIRPNGKPEKKVELRLAIKAGSMQENDDQQGLAHFMEHMNFNGTKNFKKNELVSYLQQIGVEFGADLNAYTSFDETVYILPIPTDKPGNLDKGFQIIEDWAHNALLTDKDIDDERGVVLEESRLSKGAEMRMLYKYFPKYAAGTKYAERLPIGKDDILKNFKYEKVRSFYKDWYRPDLQAVAIVGDIDSTTAMKYLLKHFAGLKNPANPRPRVYEQVKARTTSEAMVLRDKEATNASLQIMFPHSKKKETVTMADYRESLARSLVTQMLNQRFSELSRSSNPPFPYAYVAFDDMIHGYEAFSAGTMFGQDGPEKAMNALAAELLRAKQFGFTESELEMAKKQVISFYEKFYNERNTTESSAYVDEYVRNFLKNETIPGIENEYNYAKTLVPGIQVAELNSMVQGWMSNMNFFALITAPEKDEVKVPTDAELVALVKKSFDQAVTAKEEAKIAASLMSAKPAPGKVVSKQVEDGFEATTYTLSNGVKVTVKPTNFKSDEILFKGIKKGGTGQYGPSDKPNLAFGQIMNLVEEMGVGDYTPAEIEKILAGQQVSMVATIGEYNNKLEGTSTVKDLESMMQLAHLYVTAPRTDEELFKAFKDKMKMQLQFISANPQAAFTDTTFKRLYNNNPLASNPIPKAEDLEKINLKRAMEIYKDEMGSADGYHFFIVGNVDEQTALPLIETYLGSLPVAKKTPAIKDNGVRPTAGELKFKKGKEKQSLILSGYFGELPYTEDMSLRANALAEVLNIKVIEEMREKMGSIYGGGFNANVVKEPYPHYSIMMYLPCGPESVEKLLSAANEEIKFLKEKGPDAKDLDKVKAQWHEKYRTSLKENKFWSEKLESVLFWGKDKANVLAYDKWIDKLTPADIQQTAKQMFDNNRKFTSVLYPESYNPDNSRNSN